jgi:hypothetical protein
VKIALGGRDEVFAAIRRANTNGVPQPDTPNWNPAGFMRNVVESIDIIAA